MKKNILYTLKWIYLAISVFFIIFNLINFPFHEVAIILIDEPLEFSAISIGIYLYFVQIVAIILIFISVILTFKLRIKKSSIIGIIGSVIISVVMILALIGFLNLKHEDVDLSIYYSIELYINFLLSGFTLLIFFYSINISFLILSPRKQKIQGIEKEKLYVSVGIKKFARYAILGGLISIIIALLIPIVNPEFYIFGSVFVVVLQIMLFTGGLLTIAGAIYSYKNLKSGRILVIIGAILGGVNIVTLYSLRKLND